MKSLTGLVERAECPECGAWRVVLKSNGLCPSCWLDRLKSEGVSTKDMPEHFEREIPGLGFMSGLLMKAANKKEAGSVFANIARALGMDPGEAYRKSSKEIRESEEGRRRRRN